MTVPGTPESLSPFTSGGTQPHPRPHTPAGAGPVVPQAGFQAQAPGPAAPPAGDAPGDFAAAPLGQLEPENTVDPKVLQEWIDQAVASQFDVGEVWQAKEPIKFVVQCPSGQRCLVKHLDPLDLIDVGLADELDFFTKKLFPSDFDAAGNPIEDKGSATSLWNALQDTEQRCKFLELLNKLCAQAVVKPQIINDGVRIGVGDSGQPILVAGARATPEQRDQLFPEGVPARGPGQAYASSLPFNDKMAIFEALNKPLEMIEPFREPSTGVQHLAPVQGAGGETQ